jgi:4-diphosphocytidyl-2-C-methyl-D-erythritol kinase
MDSLVIFSPAKTNFLLAVTGRRADGYHDLVSVVAPLTFGDTIRLERRRGETTVDVACDQPDVPTGPANLAVRAVDVFRAATGIRDGATIAITKRIPLGAGLGGGSSNAVAVLRGLNVLHDHPLDDAGLAAAAAAIGSDCPLFLAGGVCVMRGRGERITHLTPPVRHRFAQARLLLFKPDFGVSTPWAYRQLATTPGALVPVEDAEARLAAWLGGSEPVARLLGNSFEAVVHRKFVALGLLAAELRRMRGVDGVLLSGSGSASFALLGPEVDASPLLAKIRETLGGHTFVQEARVA